MKNPPKRHHEVSKTYLKQFSINPKERQTRSFINCLRIHPNKKIESKSIDSDFFKSDNFYTLNTSNPFELEEKLARDIEPKFNDIMSHINQEIILSRNAKLDLLIWIWVSKYRNSHYRKTIEQHINFINAIKVQYSNEFRTEFNELKEEFRKWTRAFAKHEQLSSLFNLDHFLFFQSGMVNKHWIVLKSNVNNRFITNDNPGFSVDFNGGKPDYETVNVQFATKHETTNYYPLSPGYCLMISPFSMDTPPTLNYWNLKLRYVETNDRHIDFINGAAYFLIRKFCVANNNKFLQKYLDINLPAQKVYSSLPISPVGGVLIREGEEDLTEVNREPDLNRKE